MENGYIADEVPCTFLGVAHWYRAVLDDSFVIYNSASSTLESASTLKKQAIQGWRINTGVLYRPSFCLSLVCSWHACNLPGQGWRVNYWWIAREIRRQGKTHEISWLIITDDLLIIETAVSCMMPPECLYIHVCVGYIYIYICPSICYRIIILATSLAFSLFSSTQH
jgi:hypothetical protein